MFLKLQNWKLKEVGSSEEISANVPGDITNDLYRAGKIPDPYFGLNHLKLREVADRDFVYTAKFFVKPDDIGAEQDAFLKFKGVDLFSEIFLNGVRLGDTDNMFKEYVFCVNDILKDGENTLEVKMRSATAYMKSLDCKNYFAVFNVPRIFLRKEQCCFGWDWAPDIPGYGIWQDVELYTESKNKITNVRCVANDRGEAVFHLEINYSVRPYYTNEGDYVVPPKTYEDKLRVLLAKEPVYFGEGESLTEKAFEGAEICETDVGGYKSFLCFHLRNAALWYPIGYGRQPLYPYKAQLVRNGKVIDEKVGRIGFRSVALSEPVIGDTMLGYKLIVNGVEVYPRGANWVPIDCFTGRIEDQKYKKLIDLAAEGSFNMLRVWGGGIYEKDIFYDFCDEKGVMVWQDFMFACADIPENEKEWAKKAEEECVYQVKRLRNHPSLVYWCGGNEKTGSFGAKISLGDRFTNVILRGIVDHYDGTRPFARQSPCSHTDGGNDCGSGESHFSAFEPSMKKGYDKYRETVAETIVPFASECATMGPHSLETYRKIFPENKLFPMNELWNDRLMENPYAAVKMPFAKAQLKAATDLYGAVEDIRSFIEKASLAHAEMLSCQIGFQRAHKGLTSGFLLWMYSEPWPSGTWSVIDFYTEPKQAYYAVKRAFSDLYFGFYLEQDGSTYLFGVRDRVDEAKIVYECELKTFDGEILESFKGETLLDNKAVFKKKLSENFGARNEQNRGIKDSESTYLYVKFYEKGDEQHAKTTLYSIDMWKQSSKNFVQDFQVETETQDKKLLVRITAKQFAKSVFLHFKNNFEYRFSDNYFDVEAGSSREIIVTREDGGRIDATKLQVECFGSCKERKEKSAN